MSKLPKPPKEVPAERGLQHLAPKMREKVIAVLEDMREQGLDPFVAETIRTPERVAYLHGFGRLYDDGRGRVTEVRDPLTGMHPYGLAVDIWSVSKLWKASETFWDALAGAARKHGLEAGADWKRRDRPHIQWRLPDTSTPTPRMRQLKQNGGNEAVWRHVGAA